MARRTAVVAEPSRVPAGSGNAARVSAPHLGHNRVLKQSAGPPGLALPVRGFYNAQMPTRHIRKLCTLDEAGERTLEMAVRRMGLSARAHDRILKLARTIADVGEFKTISAKHVAEAVQYRSLDRNYWN